MKFKRITALFLSFSLILSTVLPVVAQDDTGNSTSFTADFTAASTQWEGDLTSQLGYTPSKKTEVGATTYGNVDGWNNAKGSISTKDKFDFGEKFDAEFSLYTRYRNGDKNGTTEDFYVSIGKLKIAICDFQTRIEVYYDGTKLTGTNEAKADITYPNDKIRDYTYAVHVENGNVTIESDLIKYTATIDNFVAVNDEKIEVTINETSAIHEEFFGSLTVQRIVFVPVLGDVDGDGQLLMSDKVAFQKHFIAEEEVSEDVADINSNSEVDICDYVELLNLFDDQIISSLPTDFTADFTSLGGWAGDTSYINAEKGFGADDKWADTFPVISSINKYDFGSSLDAEFQMYSYDNNSSANHTMYTIVIGDFEIEIRNFQRAILVKHKGKEIQGHSVCSDETLPSNPEAREASYKVKITPGAISIQSDIVTYTSSYDEFDVINNATVAIKKIETYHTHTVYIKNLSVKNILE